MSGLFERILSVGWIICSTQGDGTLVGSLKAVTQSLKWLESQYYRTPSSCFDEKREIPTFISSASQLTTEMGV